MKTSRRSNASSSTILSESSTPYCLCPHQHFRAPLIDRSQLNPKDHIALLATPRGYRWNGDFPPNYTGPKSFSLLKPIRKKNHDDQKKLEEAEQRYMQQFVSHIFPLMSAEMVVRLKRMLVVEFGMTPKKAGEFIKSQNSAKKNNKKNKANKCYEIDMNVKGHWLKEFERLLTAKMTDYLVSLMCARRSKKVETIAENVLNHICDISGEWCTLDDPQSKLQRIQVFLAERFAVWLANLLEKADKTICEEYMNWPSRATGKKSRSSIQSAELSEDESKPTKIEEQKDQQTKEEKEKQKEVEEQKPKDEEEKQKEPEEEKPKEEEEKPKVEEEKPKKEEEEPKVEEEKPKEEEEKPKVEEEKPKKEEEEPKVEEEKPKEGEDKSKDEEKKQKEEEEKQKELEEQKLKEEEEERQKEQEEQKQKEEEEKQRELEEQKLKEEEERQKELEEQEKKEEEEKQRELEELKQKEEEEKRTKELEEQKQKEKEEHEAEHEEEDEEIEKEKEEDEDLETENEEEEDLETDKEKEEEDLEAEKEEVKEELEAEKEEEEEELEEQGLADEEVDIDTESAAGDVAGPDSVEGVIDVIKEPEPDSTMKEEAIKDESKKSMGDAVTSEEQHSQKTMEDKYEPSAPTPVKKKGAYRIIKNKKGCYFEVQKIDQKEICDRTKIARKKRVAIVPTSICERPKTSKTVETSTDMKKWSKWATDVVNFVEKWSNWIVNTSKEMEARAGEEHPGDDDNYRKLKEKTEIGALELKRNKKYVKQTSIDWKKKLNNEK